MLAVITAQNARTLSPATASNPEKTIMPLVDSRCSTTSRHLAIGLLLLAPLLLGADDYLHEIEEEAKRQATTLVIDQPQPAPVSVSTTQAGGASEQLATGLDFKAFEQALRESLPGTYTSYQQLNSEQKRQIYDFYRNDNRLANISEQIARLLNGK